MKRIARVVIRFLVVAVIEALSLLLMDWLVPGITLFAIGSADILTVAMSVALVLALMNSVIRPILVLLTLPFNVLTFGFSTLIINGGMLLLAARLLPYFEVVGWGAALLGALLLAVINTFLSSLTTIDDDYSFYDGVVQWLSRRRLVTSDGDTGRGLVILEIDGLSYQRLRRAIDSGLMPTLQQMLRLGSHRLSSFDCGLPSQTSAAQAGIMYGNNYDIPAFRWYDKDRGKLIVSNNFSDAAELNGRYANGRGLLRGGTSINNLMSGDARKAMLTMSVLTEGPEDVERRSSEDLYLVFLNPYFFTRTVVLTLWDILVELAQGVRQRLRNVQPRVNRLHKAYPLLRALTNVFLRDVSTYMVIMDVIRGSPAIYASYMGYDEIAHYAGPDRADAMNSLKGIDTQLRRILDVIRRKAPRPYDVILLSDHGQSSGATFKQRYGHTLTSFIDGLVAAETKVTEVNATENSRGYTAALLAEIQGMEERVTVDRVRGATIGRTRKVLQKRVPEKAPPTLMDTQVIVGVSGNLAHIYFDLHLGKVRMQTLNEAYPGLIDALVAHPGVGLVVTYEASGAPWVLGKDGARNLQDGTVTGSDPLFPYGDADLRSAQLRRLAQFPHSGDLIVISTLYSDGQVAAFEELVGSHGGLGGQQTDAFLFHPADMSVPPTSNAVDIFALLDARRGLPGTPSLPWPALEKGHAWSPRTLLAGLRDVRTWITRALRALRLDRSVFHEVAEDPLATGPALFIILLIFAVSGLAASLNAEGSDSAWLNFADELIGNIIGWVLMVLLALTAGRMLRGRGHFTRTMRTLAFAQVPQLIGWLGPVPTVGPFFSVAGTVMGVLATWIALQEALRLRKLLAALIPLVGLVVAMVAIVALSVFLGGMALALETILSQLRLTVAP